MVSRVLSGGGDVRLAGTSIEPDHDKGTALLSYGKQDSVKKWCISVLTYLNTHF
jgi:hypothetical protein